MRTPAIMALTATLLVFPALLGGTGEQPARPATVAELLKRQGLPAFTARSLQFRQGRLRVAGLESVDPAARTADQFKGRTLIVCSPWDELWLWTAATTVRMQDATPLLGHEGPGARPGAGPRSIDLPAPARARLVQVDDTGAIVGIEDVTITELEILRDKPARRR